MKALFLYTVLFLGLVFPACQIVDSDSMPDKVEFSVRIEQMKAYKSCEGDGTSGVGDIYTRIQLYRNETPGGQSLLVAEIPDIYVGLSKGETKQTPELSVSAEIAFFDGMRLEGLIHTYEKDPNSVQVSELFFLTMKYDGAQKCWVGEEFTTYAGVCVPGSSGDVKYLKTTESRMKDNMCDIEYLWTAEVKPL